jgi:hypothetical protein
MRISVYRKTTKTVSAEWLRRREFHAVSIGSWIVYWWPKGHWSENL